MSSQLPTADRRPTTDDRCQRSAVRGLPSAVVFSYRISYEHR